MWGEVEGVQRGAVHAVILEMGGGGGRPLGQVISGPHSAAGHSCQPLV